MHQLLLSACIQAELSACFQLMQHMPFVVSWEQRIANAVCLATICTVQHALQFVMPDSAMPLRFSPCTAPAVVHKTCCQLLPDTEQGGGLPIAHSVDTGLTAFSKPGSVALKANSAAASVRLCSSTEAPVGRPYEPCREEPTEKLYSGSVHRDRQAELQDSQYSKRDNCIVRQKGTARFAADLLRRAQWLPESAATPPKAAESLARFCTTSWRVHLVAPR